MMPSSMPGRFNPLRERSWPPTATVHSTSLPVTRSTTSCTRPSLMIRSLAHYAARGSKLVDALRIANNILVCENEAVTRA